MKTVLILTEYFYPAYKAGGPIQSITNLILALEDEYNFYVVTSAYDMRSTELMKNIKQDNWNKIGLPGSRKTISVWYSGQHKISTKLFRDLLQSVQPDVVYLNGMFSFRLFLIPLFISKKYLEKLQIVICPRGMLQKGALTNKFFKKKIYLHTLKLMGLVKTIKWHATNLEEENDIKREFPNSNNIVIAMNIPKKPKLNINIPSKSGNLKLIYLSLIAEKKNLLFLLNIINSTENVSLDIYGPVKDIAYWNKCKKVINKMSGKVKYCGTLLPSDVQHVLSTYHSLILLTRGENFGHALYESLSVGRPIITSHYTPWNNLKNNCAGWNVDIKLIEDCTAAVEELNEMSDSDYASCCEGAFELASNYYYSLNTGETYRRLFA